MNATLSIFLLSLAAGLATGLGGLIAVIRKPGKRLFGFLMGFSAGVMIAMSFVDLVNEAWESSGFLMTTLGFSIGAFFMFSIDFVTPHIRFANIEKNVFDTRLMKTGILIAIGIAIHNIPEGIAVGAGYMHIPKFGFFIAFAIALHNIPEGIATALPLCKSGVCKMKSFKIALFSGLVEPIGALIAAIFLASFKGFIPLALAFAAGVMVFITLDEIIPAAREYGHNHFTAIGIILGTIFIFLLSGFFRF